MDIAFLSNNCREEFVLTELFHEPLLCITPMDWPEPPNGVMTPALMNGQNFVVQWDATDAEMRQFLKKYSISTERRCHVIDDQSNIAMVEAGLGISIMPRMLLRNCTAAVKIYPIEPEEDRVVGLAVQRPTAMLPPWSRCSTTSWSAARIWTEQQCNITGRCAQHRPVFCRPENFGLYPRPGYGILRKNPFWF